MKAAAKRRTADAIDLAVGDVIAGHGPIVERSFVSIDKILLRFANDETRIYYTHHRVTLEAA